MFTALVLAGSRDAMDPVAAYAGVVEKALIPVGGRTMLARVVDVLRAAGADRIVVAVSSEAVADHASALGVETTPAAAGPSDSARRGLALLGAPLLITTADHPLLRPEWITEFIAAVPEQADLAILLASRQTIERDLETTRRTYFRFSDGAWSGCNLFYLATPRSALALSFWASVEADRKNAWRIVRRLGVGLLVRYLIGRLPLAIAVDRLGSAIGVRPGIVSSRSGLAAVDVDTPADLELVRRLIG